MLFFKLFPGIQRSGPKRHDVAGLRRGRAWASTLLEIDMHRPIYRGHPEDKAAMHTGVFSNCNHLA
jgi:hypothetical protein